MRTSPGSKNFDVGFQSDIARDQLAGNAAFRLKDYIPQNEAPLRKRGGYGYATADLNGISASAAGGGLGWAPFQDDPYLLICTDTGKVIRAPTPSSSSGVLIAAGGPLTMTHRPFWHRDRMILPASMKTAAFTPKKVYSTGPTTYALADIGGTPPQARVGASWGDYLILANGYLAGTLYTRRLWWSSAGNSDVWSTGAGGSWTDFDDAILRVLPMRDFILVWGYSMTWMLRGDTPPPGGNMDIDDLFIGNGTFDGRTVTTYRDSALWANSTGVWKSDGATLTDLCEQGGISLYWKSLVKDLSFDAGWGAAAGILNGHYLISFYNAAGTHVTTLACDLDRAVWTEHSNLKAYMYAERSTGPGTATAVGAEELFFSHLSLPRAGMLSQLWRPTSTNENDADGTAVQPVLETPYYKLNAASLKRLSRVFLTYYLEAGGGAPTLEVDVLLDPWHQTYTLLTPSFPVTPSGLQRLEAFISDKGYGAAFRVRQVGASADTRLAEVELAGHKLEESR